MHVSVLKKESIAALRIKSGRWYLDGTFGRGGHTRAILEAGGKVVAFDVDEQAIQYGQKEFAAEIEAGKLRLVQSNFANLSRELYGMGFDQPGFVGALFDLGMSSNQLEESGRGFSFQKDEPLDMRMSQDLGVTAADLVNALPEKHLKNLIWENSQETFARPIAKAIAERRLEQPFRTTKDLAGLITNIKRGRGHTHLHPATKVFQALRIAVNMELDNLTVMLDQVLNWLTPGSRLVLISFHEGEDRIVKHRFQVWEDLGRGVMVGKKPVEPGEEELAGNPRSRSAKLRVFEVV
jgi:16S rRNA (cytosine1402-N4)-methyltransferase